MEFFLHCLTYFPGKPLASALLLALTQLSHTFCNEPSSFACFEHASFSFIFQPYTKDSILYKKQILIHSINVTLNGPPYIIPKKFQSLISILSLTRFISPMPLIYQFKSSIYVPFAILKWNYHLSKNLSGFTELPAVSHCINSLG